MTRYADIPGPIRSGIVIVAPERRTARRSGRTRSQERRHRDQSDREACSRGGATTPPPDRTAAANLRRVSTPDPPRTLALRPAHRRNLANPGPNPHRVRACEVASRNGACPRRLIPPDDRARPTGSTLGRDGRPRNCGCDTTCSQPSLAAMAPSLRRSAAGRHILGAVLPATTGTYSANVGTSASSGAASRSLGEMPIRANSTRAASSST